MFFVICRYISLTVYDKKTKSSFYFPFYFSDMYERESMHREIAVSILMGEVYSMK